MERRDIDYNDWNEDFYPSRGILEEEYEEEWEEEDEDYEHQYSPIQGNWDLNDFEEADSFQKMGRQRVRKVQSVKTYDAIRTRERQNQKRKIRNEAKAREKQRQQYYHYEDTKEEA